LEKVVGNCYTTGHESRNGLSVTEANASRGYIVTLVRIHTTGFPEITIPETFVMVDLQK
jgi:hypothetical protein